MAHADAETRPDTIWLNARLATFAADRPGIGAIERGALAARDGRLRLRRRAVRFAGRLARRRADAPIAAAAGSRLA